MNKKLLYAVGFFLVISVYFGLNIGCLLTDNYLDSEGGIVGLLTGNVQIGIKNVEYTYPDGTKTKIDNYKCSQDYTLDSFDFNLKDTLCDEAKNSIMPTYIFSSIILILGFVKVYFIAKGKRNIYLDLFLSLSVLAIIIMNAIVLSYIVQLSDKFNLGGMLEGGSSIGATVTSLALGGIIFLGLIIEIIYNHRKKLYTK